MPPSHIAILGGGISGLSSAFHLSRRFPSSRITVLEKGNRFGGWVRSDRVDVQDGEGNTASLLVEAGPRTLRPSANGVMELINLLDLSPSLLTTPKSSPAARNRFLHIPCSPHFPGLSPLPSSAVSLLRSPLFSKIIGPILREPFRWPNRPALEDESVESFLSRRFGPEFARTFGSALIHGIYAADSRKLSVRSAFPALWDAEASGMGSILRGFWINALKAKNEVEGRTRYQLGCVEETLKDVSVFSFKNGIGEVTSALEGWLKARPGVEMVSGTSVRSLEYDRAPKTFEIKTTSDTTLTPTHVVSTIPLPSLHTILPFTHTVPHLTHNPYSSVLVVNLLFPTDIPLHPQGFGYLVPRPPNGYENAQDAVLGCVFDSCAITGQDSNAQNLTKMTMMLGGPFPLPANPEQQVLDHLERVVSSKSKCLPKPIWMRSVWNKECIPTMMPGHLGRMEELRVALEDFGEGRLEVVGAGVGGVSVGDCVEAGRGVGKEWV